MLKNASLILAAFLLLTPWTEKGLAGKERASKHPLKIPPGFIIGEPKSIIWKEYGYELRLISRNFSQGDAVYLELLDDIGRGHNLTIQRMVFQDKVLLFSRKPWGIRAIFSIDPQKKAGSYILTLDINLDRKKHSEAFSIDVNEARFPVFTHELDLGKYSNMSYLSRPDVRKRIIECALKKKKAFSLLNQDMLSSRMSHPSDVHEISSPFWAKRYYYTYRVVGGKRKKTNTRVRIHRGLDLKGEKGAPVYALADGIIALAEEMFYEGNFVIIDHGNRVFSYYMHQDSLAVKEGQKIRGGDLIGYIGSTGVSTGAHLHVSLLINGTQADPLSLLWLPVKK